MTNNSWAETPSKTETLVWNRGPMRIALPVNHERRVDFPVEVVVYIPDSIADKLVVTATLEGSLFWQAKESFKTERMIITDKSGRIQWLLDVGADSKAPQHTLIVQDNRVLAEFEVNGIIQHVGDDQSDSVLTGNVVTVLDEVDLIKVAARQFYGPQRLAEIPQGVTGDRINGGVIDIYRGVGIDAMIQGSWRTSSWEGELFVTAVRISNRSTFEIRPDPRRVKGQWLAIAAQHAWLAPAGQFPQNTTFWYLVSNRPYQEVLTP